MSSSRMVIYFLLNGRSYVKSYWILHFTFEAPVGVFESRFLDVSGQFCGNFRQNHSRDRSIFDLIDFPTWIFIICSTFQWKPLRENNAIRLISPRSKQRMRIWGEREKQRDRTANYLLPRCEWLSPHHMQDGDRSSEWNSQRCWDFILLNCTSTDKAASTNIRLR